MTNIVAAIIVTVSTNWVSIGTFTEKAPSWPKTYDVQAGNLQTNTTAILEFEAHKREFVLKSVLGPVVGERKIENPAVTFTNQFYMTPWPTNIAIPL